MHITVLGDSITKGVIFDEARSRYTFMKQSAMNMIQSQLGEIKNLSKFGCTTEKGLSICKKNESSVLTSDYTILEYGGNDCDMPWKDIAERPDSAFSANIPIDQFEMNYSALIQDVLHLGSKPVLMTLPPLDQDRFFQWVSKTAEGTEQAQEKILQYLKGTTETIYRWQESYNEIVRKLADRFHLPLIDIRSAFLSHSNYKDLISIDGMHPNQDGQNLIAKVTLSFFSAHQAAPKLSC